MFEQLYDACRKCGMGVFEFWDYTYGEIIEFLHNYKEKQEQTVKEQTMHTYQIALLTAVFINRANNGKQPPTLQEIYPNLFSSGELPEAIDNSWIIQKEMMLDYAEGHNKQRKGGQP